MPLRRLAVIALLLAALGGLWWVTRGPSAEALEYLPRNSPMVLCERADDPEAKTPIERSHWFATLPLPQAPAGTFARSMQPRVLRDLGFAAGERVCAAPIVPPIEKVQEQGINAAVAFSADRALQGLLNGCVCAGVRESGRMSWTPSCGRIKSETQCRDRKGSMARFDGMLAELQAALAMERPRLHWRVVGPVGRSGRFRVAANEHLEWLEYPGRVSTPEDPATGDESDPLVRALLLRSDVTAVIRQGRGQAILVVREIGDAQVLDYFENLALPKRWGADWSALDADLLGARLEGLLALPRAGASMESQLSEAQGKPADWLADAHGLAHLDHARLDDYDRLLLAARELDGLHYDESKEVRKQDELLVDDLTLAWNQAGLRGRVGLSFAGQAWWGSPVAGEFVVQHAKQREEEPVAPQFEPASKHPFLLRAQPIELALFDSLRGFPRVVGAVFGMNAQAVSGDASAFTMELPEGRVAGDVATVEGLAPLQSYLSARPHTLSVKVDAPNGFALFELQPR